MKKIFYSLSLLFSIVINSYAQNVLIGPGYSNVQNSTNSRPLSVGMRSGYTGYLDFLRGGVYSAGILNINSPKQLKIGIANNTYGVNYYEDIVIDSTNRRIGFGTNNPSTKWHFYSTSASNDDILVEGSDYPFLILKSKVANANEGFAFKSSNDNFVGMMFHYGVDKTMRWGFGSFPNDVVIDSTTRNVGLGITNPSSKLHTYNNRDASYANVRVEQQSGVGGFAGISLEKGGSGAGLYGNSTTNSINVANLSGSFAAVNASAFNVISDIASKKEVDYLGKEDYEAYISQIRDIKSATYRYNWENARTRTTPHIGFIAQSLPSAVTNEMSLAPDGSSDEKYVGYNLSDMAGLTVMGIKAVDARTLKLEETIKAQQVQIDILIKEIEKLKK